MRRRLLLFALLAVCLVLVARVSERYGRHLDLSEHRINSLSTSAERALDALPGPLEMTALMPDYPVQRAQLEQLLAPYLAHPNRPRLDFVDPVREPERARALGVKRHGELQLRIGPRRETVVTPSTQAIDAALNRLALRGERWIVSLRGHGEDEINERPGGLGRFVSQVEGLGYRVISIDPRQVDRLPENTAVLLIAGPRRAYGQHSREQIERFIAGGGQLLWLVGDGLPAFVGDRLGVELLPGIVVDATAAQYGLQSPDNAIVTDYPGDLLAQAPDGPSVLQGAHGLVFSAGDDWRLAARLQTGPLSWNETGELQGRLARNPELGEQAGPLTVGLALQRELGSGQQRAVILGSRHLISNDQIGQAENTALAIGLLHWLSANAQLSSRPVAQGLDIRWTPGVAGLLAVGLMGLLPGAYLAAGLWLRSRRRKA